MQVRKLLWGSSEQADPFFFLTQKGFSFRTSTMPYETCRSFPTLWHEQEELFGYEVV
jgi:hypothetical protein